MLKQHVGIMSVLFISVSSRGCTPPSSLPSFPSGYRLNGSERKEQIKVRNKLHKLASQDLHLIMTIQDIAINIAVTHWWSACKESKRDKTPAQGLDSLGCTLKLKEMHRCSVIKAESFVLKGLLLYLFSISSVFVYLSNWNVSGYQTAILGSKL